MGQIQVLPFSVANLIAAGEVVDRPASVVKELMENAIDSGADRVTVEIRDGGVTYMRVTDNGCGMEPDELPVAIRRHATSKIRQADDLAAIMTLGFRGEALAAIAAVSRLRILSRKKGAASGSELNVIGGDIVGHEDRACAEGTTVTVEELFANVPARLKFLKKNITETAAVGAVVERVALSHPEISFRYIADGTVKVETAGDGKLMSAVYAVFGRDFASRLLPVDFSLEGVTVRGFIGVPENVRPNRNFQNFFINGRFVRSKTAGAAIEQAYVSYIQPERFPACVLNIEINPMLVDVNVHPAKMEVKFSNEKPVFEAVYYAVKSVLEESTKRPDLNVTGAYGRDAALGRVSDMQVSVKEGKTESLARRQLTAELFREEPEKPARQTPGTPSPSLPGEKFSRMSAEDFAKAYGGASRSGFSQKETAPSPKEPARSDVPVTPARPAPVASDRAEAAEPPARVPEPPRPAVTEERTVYPAVDEKSGVSYRIVGEVFHSYIIVETGEKMLLIDKHAAHERVLFEKLKAGLSGRVGASQMLMIPIEVTLTSDEVSVLSEYRKEIEAVGFSFSAGRYRVTVDAIPEGIDAEAVPEVLTVMADRLKEGTGSALLTRDILFEKALYQGSCKAAIKAGRDYPPEYVAWLVGTLMSLPDITHCPHGRPVAMELSKKKLDTQFERS